MLSTILVPLDGSAFAERALPYATTLARAAHARLLLLRAVLAHPLPGTDPAHAQLTAVQHAEAALTAVAERLRRDGLPVDTAVYYDEAATAIADAAHYRHADLIVMSTHGRTGLGRWLYGSVADRVLRRAEVPLLLIPATCERGWSAEGALRVLVPLDGSALAEEALATGREMVLLLVQVVEPPAPIVADGASYIPPFDEDTAVALATQYLKRLADSLLARVRTVEIHTAVGEPAACIAQAARQYEADVVAMATHGHGGLARLVLGSVATGVLARASTPLLLVRPAAVREAARVTPPAAATGPAVTVTLRPDELALVEEGLEELLRSAKREAGARNPGGAGRGGGVGPARPAAASRAGAAARVQARPAALTRSHPVAPGEAHPGPQGLLSAVLRGPAASSIYRLFRPRHRASNAAPRQ
jgi:nucleotide-binding universal stress UspA family protein